MPVVRAQGPITFPGQLVAYTDPAQDDPYTEQIIVSTVNPVQFTDNKVEYNATGGNAAQAIYTTV